MGFSEDYIYDIFNELEKKSLKDSFHKQLKNFRVPKLFGLAFDSQEVDKLITQPWDVPLDGIITPTRFIK